MPYRTTFCKLRGARAGIPGGKQINLIVAFVCSIWVGWVFSTVGAFGGVLAGVGYVSVFDLGAYAKTFKDSALDLNKFVTDSIRVSTQWLVGLSAAISSSNNARQKRLIIPLGVSLGLGSLLAAFLVVYTTMGKVKFSEYQGHFGLIVFIVGAFLLATGCVVVGEVTLSLVFGKTVGFVFSFIPFHIL
jgi:hypothetical protein